MRPAERGKKGSTARLASSLIAVYDLLGRKLWGEREAPNCCLIEKGVAKEILQPYFKKKKSFR